MSHKDQLPKTLIRAAAQNKSGILSASRVNANFVPHDNFSMPNEIFVAQDSCSDTNESTLNDNNATNVAPNTNLFVRTKSSTDQLNHRYAFAASASKAHFNQRPRTTVSGIVHGVVAKQNKVPEGIGSGSPTRQFSTASTFSSLHAVRRYLSTDAFDGVGGKQREIEQMLLHKDIDRKQSDLFMHILISRAAATQIIDLLSLDPASVALKATPKIVGESYVDSTPLNQWEFSYVHEDEADGILSDDYFVLKVQDAIGRAGTLLFDANAGPLLELISELDFVTYSDPERWRENGFVFR